MKKMYVKKFISVILGCMITICFGACGTDEGIPQDQIQTFSHNNEESNDPKKFEDVVLTVYCVSTGEAPITSGIQDDKVAKIIKEKTGVTLDITINDRDKTNAIVSSGDLYDLNVFDSVEYIDPLIRTQAVMPLDDLLSHAPALTENFQELIDYSKNNLSAQTGKLYVLPSRAKTEKTAVLTSQDGNFMRWDYYEEIGKPEINSVDDLVNAVAQIVKNHPKTDDGKKIYGFQSWVDWGTAGVRVMTPMRKYAGNDVIGPLDSYSIVDHSYRDLYHDKNDYWLNAELLYKANQRGILDPESFTQKHETSQQKIYEGRIINHPYEWLIQSNNVSLDKETNGEGYYLDIPFKDTKQWPAWVTRNAPLGYTGRMFFVSSKCENPEAVMGLLNFVYSEEGARTIFNGEEGTEWETGEDGIATFKKESLEAMESDSTYMSNAGMKKYLGIVGRDYDAYAKNGQYLDLTLEEDYVLKRMNRAEKKYCKFYGVKIPSEVMINRKNQGNINLGYASFMPTNIPVDISRSVTKIENYIIQEMPGLVFSKNDKQYKAKKQKMQIEIKALGYNKVRDFYKTAFENAVLQYNNYQ